MDSKTAVQHREGKTDKGKDWSFYQQTITVSVGGDMYEVNFRADNEPVPAGSDLCLYDLDEVVRIRVGSPRVYAGKVSFDAAQK